MTANPKPRSILLLQQNDEVRYLYENALAAVGVKAVWFSSLESLLAAAPNQEPLTVVVDLDSLTPPLDGHFEKLRGIFAGCDLVALSASDSAQLALQCIRSGFTDFLIKPTSPEELAWSIRKSQQRHDVFQRLNRPKAGVVRAISQISSGTTPALVRLYVLEYVVGLFQSKGAAWLKLDPRGPEFTRILCAVPKRIDASEILFELPYEYISFDRKSPLITRRKTAENRKLLLPCGDYSRAAVFLWGIKGRVTRQKIGTAALVLEHGELSLLNIQKFEEIKHQNFVDDLTGLYNSRYLKFALTSTIARCRGPKESFSVLFIDVDHFKSINDKHGHLVGSEFLVAIGKTIRHAVRNIDPVFRYGGDEFVAILNGMGVEGAKEIAERIRKNIERRVFIIKNERIQTTVSIGIATYPLHASERETLLRLADEAMYAAKRKTRNAVHLATGIKELNV